jgi:iron complex outermembrane receptor protein
VTSGAQRGTNGLSAANLRGQGAAATLVLLNGRRVAAHGLTGGAVDVNQIPFAAIERVEVLKDGASAIYGTDAVGGVINFITRKDYQGLDVSRVSPTSPKPAMAAFTGSLDSPASAISTRTVSTSWARLQ